MNDENILNKVSKKPNIVAMQAEIDFVMKKITYLHRHSTDNKKDASSKIALKRSIARLKKMKKFVARQQKKI